MMNRRSYFTLIEILLAMALFGLVVGAVAINVRYVVVQQRFLNEVNAITDTLNRAQQLMIIHDKPMRVKFSVVEKGIKCSIESDCNLDSAWEKWILDRSKVLTEIHSLNFKDLNHLEAPNRDRVFHFFPNGGGISRGVITLSSASSSDIKGAMNSYICLPGYPTALKAVDTLPEQCDEITDQQIGFITRAEVLERVVNFE